MTELNAHALHVFAPNDNFHADNWVEQILGNIVRPVLEKHDAAINWIWVTRYSGPYSEDNLPQGCRLPESHLTNGAFRYIVFRFSADYTSVQGIMKDTVTYATNAGCFCDPTGWLRYDVVADLGSDRFIHANATPDERQKRAVLVAKLVDATVRLMIDALVQESNGQWLREPNTNRENPNGSLFESVHHLYCNATQAPLSVLLLTQSLQQFQVGTFWMQPLQVALEPNTLTQIPLRY